MNMGTGNPENPEKQKIAFWLHNDFCQWLKSKMVDLFLKLKIDPNLVGFNFGFKSLCWLYEL